MSKKRWSIERRESQRRKRRDKWALAQMMDSFERQVVRQVVRQRSHCMYCERLVPPAEQTIDHIIPKVDGGTRRHENKVMVCLQCNRAKKDKPLFMFLRDEGLRVSAALEYHLMVYDAYFHDRDLGAPAESADLPPVETFLAVFRRLEGSLWEARLVARRWLAVRGASREQARTRLRKALERSLGHARYELREEIFKVKPKPETTYTATYEVADGEWLAKVVELPGVEARGGLIAQARARLQQEIKARTGVEAAELEERIIA